MQVRIELQGENPTRGLLYVNDKLVFSDEGMDLYLILQNFGDFILGQSEGK